jgi:cysteinyl-tRNA synthetase
MFPHHENEIAQSNCAGDRFATIWMHNEMLQVEGRKMSKSLGNFFTVRDLLDQGWPGEVIRLVFLGTHYRKPMDWTEKKAGEARQTLEGWFRATDGVEISKDVPSWIVEDLASDLNTPELIADMHGLARSGKLPELKAAMRFLGLPSAEDVDWFRSDVYSVTTWGGHHEALRPFLDEWQRLRDARDYASADVLKSRLEATGLRLKARPAGPEADVLPEFDPAKLEALR